MNQFLTKVKAINKASIFKLGFLTFLFLAIFYPVYYHLYVRFTQPDTYYSHGFLIPLISLYLVWAKRDKLKAIKLKSSILGLFVLLGGVFLHLVSLALKINFGSYLAIVVILAGLIVYLGGRALFRELFFPLAFLLFMLPLPEVVIIGIAFKMKMLAAHIGTLVVNTMGIETIRQGSTIHLPTGSLIVGDPCSGLRSLISFFALGVLFTQFCQAAVFKKWLLVVATVPVAVGSNAVRIVLLLLATHIYGEKFALGRFHDFAGLMVFVVGFAGFVIISRLLKCRLTTDIT